MRLESKIWEEVSFLGIKKEFLLILNLTVSIVFLFLQESREANSTHLVAKVFLFLDRKNASLFR